MINTTAALKVQFDLHTRLFNNNLEQVSDEDADSRKHELVNQIKWVAGHLVDARLNGIAKVAGLAADDSYNKQFARGTTLAEGAAYPSVTELLSKWNDASAAIGTALAGIPGNVLSASAPAKVPVADDTMLGLISFLLSHEAFHLGQLSILRKMAGKEAMSFK